jgi:hypothetical protein
MRAPAEIQIRTTEEIIADIAVELGADPATRANIRSMVKVVRDLKNLSPMVGNSRANVKFAKRVLKQIDELEKLFAKPPDGAVLEMLFASKQSLQSLPVDPSVERAEAVAWEARAWRQDWLISLRSRCEWIIAEKIGESGNVGNKQRKAAIAARGLCKMAGKPLAWSSPTSAYRKVASLLYEAMTGEVDQLERACEWVAEMDTDAK